MKKKKRNTVHNISTTTLKWWIVTSEQKNNLSCNNNLPSIIFCKNVVKYCERSTPLKLWTIEIYECVLKNHKRKGMNKINDPLDAFIRQSPYIYHSLRKILILSGNPGEL